jgi:hypothetical protein
LTPQVSVDGANWIALSATSLVNVNTGAYSATIASAAVGIWQCDVSGFKLFRITASAPVTGTAAVSLEVSSGVAMLALDTPLPAGANLIGGVNIAQVNGSTAVAAATGVQKVGITGNAGATVDATLGSAAPTNTVWNTAAPNTNIGAACSTGIFASLTTQFVKAGAGNAYGFSVSNTAATAIFLQFYNQTTAPTLGTGVVWWIACPIGITNFPPGALALANFATGVAIGASTTPTSTDTPSVAPNVTVFYK